MKFYRRMQSRFYRLRSRYWRENRMLFPSPAEVAFVRTMGGHVLIVRPFKHYKTGYPLAVFLTLGKTLKRQRFRREVRVGKHWVDFGNDLQWGIEIDGRAYHNDIVVQVERDEYFADYGWRVLHVDATDLYHKPKKVRAAVLRFLNA